MPVELWNFFAVIGIITTAVFAGGILVFGILGFIWDKRERKSQEERDGIGR